MINYLSDFWDPLETIAKLAYPATPAEAGGQNPHENLDSGFLRNDDQRGFDHFETVL